MKRAGFNIEGSAKPGLPPRPNASKSIKLGMRRGSEGLINLGQSFKTGVARAVFSEDLKVSEKKIIDPQDKNLLLWNKFLVLSCILAVYVDPLFFYIPVFYDKERCLKIHKSLAHYITTARTVVDCIYLIRIGLQFRTAYIAPSSRVFGRGELVIDPAQIARRYMRRYFIVDLLSVLPLPQVEIVVWRFLHKSHGSGVMGTKRILLLIVIVQYIPRSFRILPLFSELKKTVGVITETAWAGAAYYLVWFVLAGHIFGAFWYLLAVERKSTCWEQACINDNKCEIDYLYCGHKNTDGYKAWTEVRKATLDEHCVENEAYGEFDYGIYLQAVQSQVDSSENFISKYCYCLWWGLRNLSTLGQGLETSTYAKEIIFSIIIAISGLILFALLIGNMQFSQDNIYRSDYLNWNSSNTCKMKRAGFNIEGSAKPGLPPRPNASKSIKLGMRRGSEGLINLGQSFKTGVARAVFSEDLKVSEKKIIDPQDKNLLLWNKFLVLSCILAVYVDPLFFYIPVFYDKERCLKIHKSLAHYITTARTVVDCIYLIRIGLQFRTAYIAPSSRVFGRGELVIDPAQIARRYMRRYFVVDLLSVLPLPQVEIVVWRFLHKSHGSGVMGTKRILLLIVIVQYIPRSFRILPLFSELKKTVGVITETAWAGAAYYLVWFVLAGHIFGAFWYLLAVERKSTCWEQACINDNKCEIDYLYCGHKNTDGYKAWTEVRKATLDEHCVENEAYGEFDYGIYLQAVQSQVDSSENFISKYCYCLWWGLRNLSTLGQGLETSTYAKEIIFSIIIAISGLILFALLIGNMQTYLQSLSVRLEEMRIKRRDSEQWMHHRLLPQELKERVRRYDQYKWVETRGVDEESLVQSLPKDLRRDIKRHLCLNLVKRVPLFANMDERLLDAICERLKPSLYTETTYVLREGDPVDEMLFIIRGRLESVTTDGGRSGFFNRGFLKEGDFCGEELLTWALDPKAAANLPPSTRTVKALTEVEAFALIADEVKFITSQFRRLHSRQVQHTFRFYSQQWRTWAASFIQAAWRRFAANAMKRVQRKRGMSTGFISLSKPSEPDFGAE
ncbi:cyclic nucleotide gated channel 8 [Artemisia annua]|uniref:Cyclic nucleotide gated channel 8 n=1 Tax=Artemisia annua TaxID=35608 RepID=A0A2U1LDH2_ARTAN|nr:cyclic nucleotide gated channel 8 [Artemisia annua]